MIVGTRPADLFIMKAIKTIKTLSILFSLFFLLSVSAWSLDGLSMPQGTGSGVTTANEKTVDIPAELESPKATVISFLQAMQQLQDGDNEALDRALLTLDLSKVNPLVVKDLGTDLAWMLFEVIKQTTEFDPEWIPEKVDSKRYVLHSFEQGELALQRSAAGWRFSPATLKVLPEIADSLKPQTPTTSAEDIVNIVTPDEKLPLSSRIRNSIPETYKGEILTLEYWQWIGIFIFVLLGLLADKLFAGLMHHMMRILSSHAETPGFRKLDHDMLRPFGLMVMALVWWTGIKQLSLPETSLLILLTSVKFLASASGVWAAYRLVDLISAWLGDRALETQTKLDDALVPLIKRSLKIFITVIGLIFIANNLNIDITGLIAGLGLGGLAFALAAKDLAQNLFGSVTVLMEKTFMVGDWIKVGDVEGTVENIGFRSTRIRTFYNSQITLPNSNLITASVDNYGKRRYRRLSTTLQITYETPPELVEAFCEGIRELIRLHPYMRKDYYQVYLNGFSASALDIMLYVFWETPDWNTELRERHRLLVDILRLANKLGVDFAYPTQTLHWRDEVREAQGRKSPQQDQHNALQIARDVVNESTGVGNKPAPVNIPRAPLSSDRYEAAL